MQDTRNHPIFSSMITVCYDSHGNPAFGTIINIKGLADFQNR